MALALHELFLRQGRLRLGNKNESFVTFILCRSVLLSPCTTFSGVKVGCGSAIKMKVL